MWPPYNRRMVMGGGYFCRETARHPSTVGSFRMPHVEAAAINLGQLVAAAVVDGHGCRRGPRHSTV